MFESSMDASDLISLAKDSADIAPDIDEEYFLLWLNSLEGRLYTGVIRETASALCTVYREETDGGYPYVLLSEITVPQGRAGRASAISRQFWRRITS